MCDIRPPERARRWYEGMLRGYIVHSMLHFAIHTIHLDAFTALSIHSATSSLMRLAL